MPEQEGVQRRPRGPERDPFDRRLEAVKTLISIFRLERITYLIITVLSLFMLLIAASMVMLKGNRDIAILGALFGSSGLITYSLGRLLRMWDQALALLMRDIKEI